MRKTLATVALIGALGVSACDAIGQAMTAHTDVVARAAGVELTVDEAAQLLAVNPQIPLQAEVVDAIANLWIDYTLLAMAAAKDTGLTALNLEHVVNPALEQDIVFRLRDQVIKVDTAISDAELRAVYEKERPGQEVRARHILLRLPADATPQQRDSVMKAAQALRDRARAGEDFAKLARENSQEPGADQSGGDLNYFGRGAMVQPFEEAAFALEVGEISDVVETPFGFHVIKVEDRRMPSFEEARQGFREEAKMQKQLDAEENYIKGLVGPLKMQVADDAYDVARELATKPNEKLGGRAANRALVTYQGGSVTAQEYQRAMRSLPGGQRGRYTNASDEDLKTILEGLAKNEILVQEAQKRGYAITPAARDSLTNLARGNLRQAVTQSGLGGIKAQEGQTIEQAVEQKVTNILKAVIIGQQPVLPLGPLAYSLRDAYEARVYERAYADVLAKAQAMRPAPQAMPGMPGMPGMPQGQMPQGQMPQQPMPQQPPPQPQQ